MKKFTFFVFLLYPFQMSIAQDPYCMWGEDDITCQSSRALKGMNKRYKSGDAHIEELTNEFKEGLTYQNPYSLNYDSSKDKCMIDPRCDFTAKGIAHYNWLHAVCTQNKNPAACRKLNAGAYTRPPSDRYPSGGRIGVPYAPGTEPVPGVDPYANIRSAP